MKVFVCHRSTDSTQSENVIKNLLEVSGYQTAILKEREHSDNWKSKVENKLQEVDFVLFIIGNDTFESDNLKWEYARAKQLNKRIVAIKLPSATKESVLYCQGYQVFENAKQCYNYLQKAFENIRELKLEQYKMMVSSTEMVTSQRLKVNNLFFTVTSSILSVAFILGKTFDFSIAGSIGMVGMTSLAFVVTFFWEKLINSYGTLNTGKFKVIDKIEKQLRTNMFEDEWKILTQEVDYEPNTKTEATIVKRFRYLILGVGLAEMGYLGYLTMETINIGFLKLFSLGLIAFINCH